MKETARVELENAIRQLAKLESDEDDIIRDIGQVERTITMLNYKVAQEQCPFKPGDKVQSDSRIGYVVLIKPGIWNRPDLPHNWVAYVYFPTGIPTGMQLFPQLVDHWLLTGTWPGDFADLLNLAKGADTCIQDKAITLVKDGFKITNAGVMPID